MKIIQTNINDLYVIQPKVFFDDRGYFFESFNEQEFNKKFPYINFCQDNIVKSKKNVLRGLHFQSGSFSQSKLVTVIKGKILDIVVDLRKTEKTYGKIFKCILSEKNNLSIFVPKGFAHGYLTLSDEACVLYKVDNYYSPKHEKGILYNDDFLKIDWGIKHSKIIISEKDKSLEKYNW